MEQFNKILLNIPHSSVNGVFSEGSGWDYNANLINAVIKETDWHTDFIFSDTTNPKVLPFIFKYSRFLVDVERLENDPLERQGRGILYTNVNGHHRHKLSSEVHNNLLNLRRNHLEHISKEITEETILIDCHSFNDDISEDVDVCIGYNDDWSKPDDVIINGVRAIFEAAGYNVGINTPYSNSITPKSELSYKSLMIEVNKKTYLKNTCEINTDSNYAPRLSNTIKRVYDFCLL